MEIVEWLNDNAGFTMALLTAVYVIATLLIVVESRRTNRNQQRLLKQAEELERSRRRPYVVFSIDFHREVRSQNDTLIYVYATIRNLGSTSAHKVRVRTTPTLQGRLGVDAPPRTPAIVNSEITFLPPGHEKRDLVSLSKFLFEDNADDELCYSIDIDYSDITGVNYREEYVIDVAAQKEVAQTTDAQATLQHDALEHLRRISGTLGDIARTLEAPDRSRFLGAIAGASALTSSQSTLLSALLDVSVRSTGEFYVTRSFGDDCARVRPLHGDEGLELKAFNDDVEYLCRCGALHGHYYRGMLRFSITPRATELLAQIQKKPEGPTKRAGTVERA